MSSLIILAGKCKHTIKKQNLHKIKMVKQNRKRVITILYFCVKKYASFTLVCFIDDNHIFSLSLRQKRRPNNTSVYPLLHLCVVAILDFEPVRNLFFV